MIRYRLTVFRRPRGPWRETRREAIEDGIDLDFVQRDDDDPERFWWDPVTAIEEAPDIGASDFQSGPHAGGPDRLPY